MPVDGQIERTGLIVEGSEEQGGACNRSVLGHADVHESVPTGMREHVVVAHQDVKPHGEYGRSRSASLRDIIRCGGDLAIHG